MMLSGGENKRVNIGTELLTDPIVLLCDEPTSGLDSTSAVGLIRLLHSLAVEHNKTVITSIHQPSSAVFRSFDRLLLLAEGNVVYFGTPAGSLNYLREKDLACPDGYNAADHLMDLLVVDDVQETDEDSGDETNATIKTEAAAKTDTLRSRLNRRRSSTVPPRIELIQSWDRDAVAEQMDAATDGDTDSAASTGGAFDKVQKYNTSWTTQFTVLMHRCLKNSRSAIFTWLNLVKSAALGLCSGLLWFQTSNTESAVADRSSYFFFTMTYWVFDAM
jgi:ABC-type proline/glycine betaine transport system ATPase subunit